MKTTAFKKAIFGAVLAATTALSFNASAAVLGYELNINNPIFNSANGDNNVPDFQLENTSDIGSGFQITGLTLTIGDTDFMFDFNRSQTAFLDPGIDLGFTLNTPETLNNQVGTDSIDYIFTGFDAGDIFRFESDIDPDVGNVVQDYRQILFPTSLLSVSFNNGTILSQTLNPELTNLDGYTFAQSVDVPEPTTLALFGTFVLAGAGLSRRKRA